MKPFKNMKSTITITAPASLNSLTPSERLQNLGFERSEIKDRRGKKIAVFSKEGVDYQFRGAQPVTESGSVIELSVVL